MYCIARVGIGSNERRCKFKAKYGCFCGHHIKNDNANQSAIVLQKAFRTWFVKRLDRLHSATLMMTEFSSWTEITPSCIIRMETVSNVEWWDIRSLSKHLTFQLESASSMTPLPIYPSSPFTRLSYTHTSLLKLPHYFRRNRMTIRPSLYFFLRFGVEKSALEIKQLFEMYMRFAPTPQKDSMGCFTGTWISLNAPMSNFEKLYIVASTIPGEVQDAIGNTVPNIALHLLYEVLDSEQSF